MSQMREMHPQPPILRHRKNHLHYDIVLSILRQLPVKSVIRLRCVFNSLDSLITTPHFISTNLKQYNNNNNNNNKDSHDNGYVIHMPSVRDIYSSSNTNRPVCTVAVDRTFDRISKVVLPFDFSPRCSRIVGSSNGLLCFTTYANVIYLWNPRIRKFKRLPDTCLGKLRSVILGFAYHSENNDYKDVRISCLSSATHEIEVYTLSLDSWKKVEITFTTNTMFYDYIFLLPFPLVSGALHWMARIIEEEERSFDMIMAFDVNIEKFRKLALPDGLLDAYYSQTYLALFKEKLAFITSDSAEQPGFRYPIWVMTQNDVVESWNKLFVVPFESVASCFAFTEYGLLLTLWRIHNPVENKKYRFLLIDAETLQPKKDLDIQYPSFVVTYMESLVLLDGPNVLSY